MIIDLTHTLDHETPGQLVLHLAERDGTWWAATIYTPEYGEPVVSEEWIAA